ncbi:Gamma-glutamyltranspeptidase [Crocosphaera watsonii WH 0401]|nr:Gamma-glutamyltranspeptidase [Crocosphaera watsonii WH 0401]
MGVPGTVAGLAMALEKYGTISLERALQPAIKLAEDGMIVDEDLYNSLVFAKRNLQK